MQHEQMFSGGGAGYPLFKEKNWYREKIIEMSNQITDEKFLKRIYVSLRDYVNEK